MKILILGASGMLGHVLAIELENYGFHVFAISKSKQLNQKTILLDMFNISEFEYFLNQNDFDIIVNCVALLVSESEEKKDGAIFLNSYIPLFLEKKYNNTNTKIIQISTDSVFSGASSCYTENCQHDPNNFYGKTKSLGEINNRKDITIRSAFWGPDINQNSKSLLNWFLCSKENVWGYKNHMFNGVSSLILVHFLKKVIQDNITGIVHLVAKETISKSDFLFLVKHIFDTPSSIISVNHDVAINRTLVNSRINIEGIAQGYTNMIQDTKIWIEKNQKLYPHYRQYRRQSLRDDS